VPAGVRGLLVVGLLIVSGMAFVLFVAWFATLDLHSSACVPLPDVLDSECAWEAPSDISVWRGVALAQSLVLGIACLFAYLAAVLAASASAWWRSRRDVVTAGLSSAWGFGTSITVIIDRHVFTDQWLDWADFRSDVLGEPYAWPTDQLSSARMAAGWALAVTLSVGLYWAWRAIVSFRASR